jgi:hypothetical protein
MDRRHSVWLLGSLVVAALIVILLGQTAIHTSVGGISQLPQHYAIPPTFGGNRLFFGTVLALMTTADALAFGAAIDNGRFLLTNGSCWDEPAKVTVVNETILLAAVLFSTVPDVLVLLAWGEQTAPAYATLSKWDRAFNGLAALTFIVFILRRLRLRPTLLFQLQREPIPLSTQPTWEQLRPKLLLVLAITIISFGVAFGK